jgi:hypothetical protein
MTHTAQKTPINFAEGTKCLCFVWFAETRSENINQAQQFNNTAQSKQTFQVPFA